MHHQFIKMKINSWLTPVYSLKLFVHGRRDPAFGWRRLVLLGLCRHSILLQGAATSKIYTEKSRNVFVEKEIKCERIIVSYSHEITREYMCMCTSWYVDHVVKHWLQSLGLLALPHFFLRVATRERKAVSRPSKFIQNPSIDHIRGYHASVARSCFWMFLLQFHREPSFPLQ